MRCTESRETAERLFRPLAFATLIGAVAFPAYAQQDTTPPAEQTLERVTVTGSNLRRADTETPSPVQIITLEDIKRSGYTDVSDVLHNLTANGAGTLSQSFSAAFATGASGIALRGLTVGATLVLIDGHRMVPNALSDDGERSFVDVSQIPLAALDHIEILKDGASSIYGSDAIAGVINVILKKTYVGGEASAEVGISKYMDGRMRHATGTYGFGDLANDGHNAYIALEYREQDAVYSSNRPYLSQADFTSQGGNNLTSTVPSALNAGLAGSTTGYFTTPANTSTPTSFLPGCTATLYYENLCPQTPNSNLIQTPTQNINVLGSYTQNLPDGWSFNIKASLFDEHNSTNEGELASLGSNPFIGVVYGPGISPTLNAQGGTGFFSTVPATYPGNTTGGPAYLHVNFPVLATSSEDSQDYRLAADLTGSMYGWDLSLAAGYSENLIYTTSRNAVDEPALNAALNNVDNPFRVGNAYYLNSPATIASIFPTVQAKATDQLAYFTAGASRDVYQLPGGPLTIGVGLDYRHQDLDAEAPPAFADGQLKGNPAFAVGTQNVAAVYAEAAAPLATWLELDASVRHDSYADSFSSTDPKVGIKFTPIQQLAFRGTYSEGFRAPNPAENGNAGAPSIIGGFPDPVLCPNGGAVVNGVPTFSLPGNYPQECTKTAILLLTSNPDLKPEKSHSYTAGFVLEPVKGASLSLDYYKIVVDNQIGAQTSDPSFFGNIVATGAGAVRLTPVPEPFVEPDGTTVTATPPVGPVAYYRAMFINDSSTQTSGIDLDARAEFSLWKDWGKLRLDLTESHVFHYVQKFDDSSPVDLAGTHGPSVVSGDTGNPRDRAQFIVTYSRGPLTMAGTTNWMSGYSVTDPLQGELTCQIALEGGYSPYFAGGTVPSQYCRVKSFTQFDLEVSYKLSKAVTLRASVLNLFNANAPLDYATYGGGSSAPTPYQPAFAQYGAIGRFFTVGGEYRF